MPDNSHNQREGARNAGEYDKTVVSRPTLPEDDQTVVSRPAQTEDYDHTVVSPPPDQTSMPQKLRKLRKTHEGILFSKPDNSAGPKSRNTIGLIDGAVIGGVYKIKKQIGRGGMGEVYLAEHMSLDKLCALKVIPPEQVTDVGWQRFQNEAKAIAKLNHINLVKVSDLGIHESCLPFYAMELVEGETMAEILEREKTLPLKDILDIFGQLCDGLDYAHRNSIVHRDLKPANIMLSRHPGGKYGVKILDFGLAKLTQQDKNRQSLTEVGEIFGSPSYMSPEQCNGERIDNRSDIYSLGCTLFECLTGRPPFVARLAAAIVFSHQEAPAPSLESVAPDKHYKEALEVVVAKTLRKNPVERYQTMAELKGDLERIGRGEDVLPIYMSRTKDVTAELSGSRQKIYLPERDAVAGFDRGEEDADYPDDDYPGDEPFYRRPPVVVSTLVALLLVGLAGAYYYYSTHKTKDAAIPMIVPVHQAKETSGNKGAYVFEAMNDEVVYSSGQDGAEIPASLNEIKPFSKLVSSNGTRVRRFRFPVDVGLGQIHSDKNSFSFAARGQIEYEEADSVYLTPDRILIKYPQYLKGFTAGDVYGVSISSFDDSNELLKIMSTVPGVKKLIIDHCSTIKASGQKDIALYKELTDLTCIYSDIDSAIIAALPNLEQLESLHISGTEDVTTVLEKLTSSAKLKELYVNDCDLTHEDIRLIAAMPSLTTLSLNRNNLNDQDMKTLAGCKQLSSLSMLNVPLSRQTSKFLNTYPALKVVQIISVPNENAVKGPLLLQLRHEMPRLTVY